MCRPVGRELADELGAGRGQDAARAAPDLRHGQILVKYWSNTGQILSRTAPDLWHGPPKAGQHTVQRSITVQRPNGRMLDKKLSNGQILVKY